MARIVRQTDANECRRCTAYCDRVIAPAACVAQECPFLYVYDEPLSGRPRRRDAVHVGTRTAERCGSGRLGPWLRFNDWWPRAAYDLVP